jgi:uncharacterized membrane protein
MSSKRGGIHFFKTTVIGGLVFLVPVVVLIIILTKAIGLMMMVAEPMAGFLPVDSVGGVALANIIAVIAVVLLCFIAGLVARRALVRTTVESLESKVLSKVPGYVIVKGMLSGLHDDERYHLKPALVTMGTSTRIGLEIERLQDGRVVVFTPGAPNPWSGIVHILGAEQIRHLDIPITGYVENVERFGQGTDELLHPPSQPDTG